MTNSWRGPVRGPAATGLAHTTIDPARPVSDPQSRDIGTVVSQLETDVETGLTTEQVGDRLRSFGPNEIRDQPGPSWIERLMEQFRSPLVYLLGLAAAVSVLAWIVEGSDGVPLDAVVIAAIVIVNAGIGFVQERKAETAVAELRHMVTETTTVIREGVRHEVATVDIVPGDLVVLAAGDSVPADARVASANNLTAAEAALTGESAPVVKTPMSVAADVALGDRTSMVFSTTSIASGSGLVVVTATGMATEVGDIASLLDATEEPPTPLEREMARVGRLLGISVVSATAVVVAATFIASGVSTLDEAVELMLVGVSLAVAAVPEGLPAVLSLVLAVGVRRMADRNALLKRLASAETLGSTTVICTDKTGTLTRNEMSVRRITTSSTEFEVTGSGLAPQGDLAVHRTNSSANDGRQQVETLLTAGVLASDADVRQVDGRWQPYGDATEAALIVAARKAGISVEETRSLAERLTEVPFDSARKCMTTLSRHPEMSEALLLVTKGAPEMVLPLCTSDGDLAQATTIDSPRRQYWSDVVEEFGNQALRTLAIAARTVPLAAMEQIAEQIADGAGQGGGQFADIWERDLTLLGVVGIMDPPRPEVAPAVRRAQAAGIRVIMITGDHPATAARIAEEVGIDRSGSSVLTGPDLDANDNMIADSIGDTSVFSRVSPRHKLQLVEALQRDGHVVAMTGDGVNDAPALKAADIGIAMGVTGSDVSKGAADMILTDDNFATIVASVEEGRAIFANIAGFVRYLLSSNVGELLTMFFGVVLATLIGLESGDEGIVIPLVATQILWINLLTDTGPALALGIDPIDPAIMERGPRSQDERLIDREMLLTIALIGLTMAIAALAMLDLKLPGGLIEGTSDLDTARTGAFTVLVLAQLFNAFNTRSKWRSAFYRPLSNPWLIGAVGISFALQLVVVHAPALNNAFSTAPLSLNDWMVSALLASSVLWVGELRKLVRATR